MSDFQYPKLVQDGKDVAAKGIQALHDWLSYLSTKDIEQIEPYLPLLRAIAKNANER